jgi:hypothetical protein
VEHAGAVDDGVVHRCPDRTPHAPPHLKKVTCAHPDQSAANPS